MKPIVPGSRRAQTIAGRIISDLTTLTQDCRSLEARKTAVLHYFQNWTPSPFPHMGEKALLEFAAYCAGKLGKPPKDEIRQHFNDALQPPTGSLVVAHNRAEILRARQEREHKLKFGQPTPADNGAMLRRMALVERIETELAHAARLGAARSGKLRCTGYRNAGNSLILQGGPLSVRSVADRLALKGCKVSPVERMRDGTFFACVTHAKLTPDLFFEMTRHNGVRHVDISPDATLGLCKRDALDCQKNLKKQFERDEPLPVRPALQFSLSEVLRLAALPRQQAIPPIALGDAKRCASEYIDRVPPHQKEKLTAELRPLFLR